MDIYEVKEPIFVINIFKIETKTANVIPVLELYGRYIKNTAKSVVLK